MRPRPLEAPVMMTVGFWDVGGASALAVGLAGSATAAARAFRLLRRGAGAAAARRCGAAAAGLHQDGPGEQGVG